MKATMVIPDELYRNVKAKSALLGLTMREVTVELFERWLTDEEVREAGDTDGPDWVAEWLRHRIPAGEPGPTARELVEQGRGRLVARGPDGGEKPPERVPPPAPKRPRASRASAGAKSAKGGPGGKPRSRRARRADR